MSDSCLQCGSKLDCESVDIIRLSVKIMRLNSRCVSMSSRIEQAEAVIRAARAVIGLPDNVRVDLLEEALNCYDRQLRELNE